MIVTFIDPTVAYGDGHIDAACIYGNSYAGGGFCTGIKYVSSSVSIQPQIWAVWFTDEQYQNFTNENGFSLGVDDTANWRTEDSNYTISWTVKRWLPREPIAGNIPYVNEYRFSAGDPITSYSY